MTTRMENSEPDSYKIGNDDVDKLYLGSVEIYSLFATAKVPIVTLNSVPSGDEGTTVGLGATLSGGVYDDISYSWSVTDGTLSDDNITNPTWVRPDVTRDTNVQISLIIIVTGSGVKARENTSDTVTVSVMSTVTNIDVVWGPWRTTSTSYTWGRWSSTSSVRGSLGSRERLYTRSGTRYTNQTRTSNLNITQSRTLSASVSGSEWRSSPAPITWSGWSRVGSITTSYGNWSATGPYRGTLANREQRWTRTSTPTWTEQRTSNYGVTQNRSISGSSSNVYEWRSNPAPITWSGWTKVGSTSTSYGGWGSAGFFRGTLANREEQYVRTATPTWTEQRTSNYGVTESRTQRGVPSDEREWRSSPEPITWSGWSPTGSVATSYSKWVSTGVFRGTLGGREEQFDRNREIGQNYTRTSNYGATETEFRVTSHTTQYEWRSNPAPITWSGWTVVSESYGKWSLWADTGKYVGRGPGRLRQQSRSRRHFRREERVSNYGITEGRHSPLTEVVFRLINDPE